MNTYKTDDYYYNTIQPREAQLKNNAYLQTLTLGELGLILEYELHTDFHVRFSDSKAMGMRSQSNHPTADVDTIWDVPEYYFLGDFYSAHVNIYFWKIHGWIESVIERWRVANGITKIQFASTWEGGPMNDVILQSLPAIAIRAEERKNNAGSDDSDDTEKIVGIVLGSVAFAIIVFTAGLVIGKQVLAKKAHAKAGFTPVKNIEITSSNNV